MVLGVLRLLFGYLLEIIVSGFVDGSTRLPHQLIDVNADRNRFKQPFLVSQRLLDYNMLSNLHCCDPYQEICPTIMEDERLNV